MSSTTGTIVMDWVGETMSGHGTAVCVACGWFYSDRTYAKVGLRVLDHKEWHDRREAS